MELGEIRTYATSTSLSADYDPSHEWPGDVLNDADVLSPADSCYGNANNVSTSSRPSFRLLVLRTAVLPAKQTLAITDGYTQLQFGRDVAPSQDIPRIRLKEMEVSKLHATAYWDNAWHIVDMGSKHGTFIQPASSTATVRLSPPRVASVPRRLRHFDTLSIASTTFVVHIHEDRLPCAECCSTTQNEIPLFLSQKRKVSNVVPTPDTAGYLANARDPKKALTMLKHRLLVNTAEQSHVGKEVTSYLDRSARRRSLYPTSRLDSPGVVVVPRVGPSASPSQPPPLVTPAWMPPPAVTRSQPSVPLPNTNIGHRLLMAQGWTPGSSLGASQDGNEGRIALTAPLEVASTAHRAGLGMAKLTAASWDSRRRGQAERDT